MTIKWSMRWSGPTAERDAKKYSNALTNVWFDGVYWWAMRYEP